MRSYSSNALRVFLLLPGLLLLTACWTLDQDVTLNPDGSARVNLHYTTLDQSALSGNPDAGGASIDSAKQLAAGLISSSQGIDAWKDVKWSVDQNHLVVDGTFYSPDLNKVRLTDGSNTVGTWSLQLTPQGDDGWNAAYTILVKDEGESALQPMSRDDVIAAFKKDEEQNRAMVAAMQTMLAGMHESIVVHLPGTVGSTTGFDTPDSRTLSAKFDADDLNAILKAQQSIQPDTYADAYTRGVKEGMTKDQLERSLVVDAMGDDFPRATASVEVGKQAQFDYTKEVADAKAAYPDLAKQLGLEQ